MYSSVRTVLRSKCVTDPIFPVFHLGRTREKYSCNVPTPSTFVIKGGWFLQFILKNYFMLYVKCKIWAQSSNVRPCTPYVFVELQSLQKINVQQYECYWITRERKWKPQHFKSKSSSFFQCSVKMHIILPYTYQFSSSIEFSLYPYVPRWL